MGRTLRKEDKRVPGVGERGALLPHPPFRRCVLALLLGAVLAPTVQAKPSGPTNHIEGRAPSATGTLIVNDPAGNPPSASNVITVSAANASTWKPNDFRVSGDTTNIVPNDLDGDCDAPRSPCTVTIGTTDPAVTRVWKQPNGDLMTSAMLSSSLSTYFTGKAVTVQVTAPVTTLSTTGAPVSGVNTLSSVDGAATPPVTATTVNVPLDAGVLVGAAPNTTYRWDKTKGFPTTAAKGLQFTYNLDSASNNINQTDYTWTSSESSWAGVDGNGVVTFNAPPPSLPRAVTITATPTPPNAKGLVADTYTFTVKKWFDVVPKLVGANLGGVGQAQSALTALCSTGLGAQWVSAAYIGDMRGNSMESAFRQVSGVFYPEWGSSQLPQRWVTDGGLAYMDGILPSLLVPTVSDPRFESGSEQSGAAVAFVGFNYAKVNITIWNDNIDGWMPTFIYTDGPGKTYLESVSRVVHCVRKS